MGVLITGWYRSKSWLPFWPRMRSGVLYYSSMRVGQVAEGTTFVFCRVWLVWTDNCLNARLPLFWSFGWRGQSFVRNFSFCLGLVFLEVRNFPNFLSSQVFHIVPPPTLCLYHFVSYSSWTLLTGVKLNRQVPLSSLSLQVFIRFGASCLFYKSSLSMV